MTTDESDNGWDNLAEEFGLEPARPSPRADKPAAEPARPAPRPAPARPARDSRVEVEGEVDEFGAGVAPAPPAHAALYDPGPDVVADDAEEFDDSAPEPLDAGEEEEGPPPGAEGEGGKRRRRRRRRKKKGGPEPESAESAEGEQAAQAEDEAVVEEGEAPGEVEAGEEEHTPPTAMDEELEAEAAGPRPEWHVMTWMELVARLYRPT